MGLPPRSVYTLDEIAQAWGATIGELLGLAVDGKLTISVLLFGSRVDSWHGHQDPLPAGRRQAHGPHGVFEKDLWAINSRGAVYLRRFRTEDGFVEVLEDDLGIEVTKSELVVTAEERRRFEQEHDIVPNVGVEPDDLCFTHSPDYSEISLAGRAYRLSPKRRAVVQLLHEAWLAGRPWMRDEVLLSQAGSASSRMVDLFAPLEGWRNILRCDHRGRWRLNIPDRQSASGIQRTFRRPKLYLVR
ncbi:hypothetical protein [Chelativorans sp.]|uniref:hypothetical protein n=1 Tax=Chelativorans sp. TaxID=2203393 RepID=UPI0028109CFB|nr:hypothetical protein [Chelativorans sp.]